MVEPLCDIGELLPDRNEDVARLVVKALGRVVVHNVLDRVVDPFLVVELRLRADLARYAVQLAGNPDEELGSCLVQALSCTLGQTRPMATR